MDLNSKWIYCNYPEALQNAHIAEYNQQNPQVSLCRVTIPAAGNHQIFFSYQYNSPVGGVGIDKPFQFGISLYNPHSTPMTYTDIARGSGTNYHSDCVDWEGVAGKTVQKFFNSSPNAPVTVNATTTRWILEAEGRSSSGLFSGLLKFHVNASATITFYIFRDKSKINGTAVPYLKPAPYNGQYSGIADGIQYTSDLITLNANSFSTGRTKYFRVNSGGISNININGSPKTTDLRPIKLSNPSTKTVSVESDGDTQQLGNWGFIYEFPIKFYNDSKNPKTFKAYVKTNGAGYLILNNGTSLDSTKFKYLSSTPNAWKWAEITLNPGESVQDTIRWVLGTNSVKSKQFIFECNP